MHFTTKLSTITALILLDSIFSVYFGNFNLRSKVRESKFSVFHHNFPLTMASSVTVTVEPFQGGTDTGRKITVSSSYITATFTNYGATLISLCAPDRSGQKEEITLCYSTLDEIQSGTSNG